MVAGLDLLARVIHVFAAAGGDSGDRVAGEVVEREDEADLAVFDEVLEQEVADVALSLLSWRTSGSG